MNLTHWKLKAPSHSRYLTVLFHLVNIGRDILHTVLFDLKSASLPSALDSLSAPGVPRATFRYRRPATTLYDTINDTSNDREENRFSTRFTIDWDRIQISLTIFHFYNIRFSSFMFVLNTSLKWDELILDRLKDCSFRDLKNILC